VGDAVMWVVELLGGPFDGATVHERLEDPPDRLLVGRPAVGYVRVALELDGRAVYLIDDPDA
jgi:hypothetical protein